MNFNRILLNINGATHIMSMSCDSVAALNVLTDARRQAAQMVDAGLVTLDEAISYVRRNG